MSRWIPSLVSGLPNNFLEIAEDPTCVVAFHQSYENDHLVFKNGLDFDTLDTHSVYVLCYKKSQIIHENLHRDGDRFQTFHFTHFRLDEKPIQPDVLSDVLHLRILLILFTWNWYQTCTFKLNYNTRVSIYISNKNTIAVHMKILKQTAIDSYVPKLFVRKTIRSNWKNWHLIIRYIFHHTQVNRSEFFTTQYCHLMGHMAYNPDLTPNDIFISLRQQ